MAHLLFWLLIRKDKLKGEYKNINLIQYGPFTIFEKIDTISFQLGIPPYMYMYLVVIIENLKLYEPSMIID